jgi:hypothetical protein
LDCGIKNPDSEIRNPRCKKVLILLNVFGSFTEHDADLFLRGENYFKNKSEIICGLNNSFIHLHPLLDEKVG